jgi:TrmH family RNA methyltransferase
MSSLLRSRQHPFVKRCRAAAAGRAGDGDILLDGEHLIAEALAAGLALEGVLTDGTPSPAVREAASRRIPVFEAPRSVIESASPVRTPSGHLALARWTPQAADALLLVPSPLVVGLVGVQDPGNVGGVIRSADALGATGVLALDGTAHPGGWKALRGAMGSTFRIAVGIGTLAQALESARRHHVTVAASVASGGTRLDRLALAPPLLILAGNEGAGLTADAVAAADVRVSIPMRAGPDSINVGVSAALLLWEATRNGVPHAKAAAP